jgi:V/A-type H+/Na+-transporting ATPase subunit E
MDVQLKELIETIKSEGVESAEAKAKEIIDDAEKKRNDIIAAAEQESEKIIKNAGKEAESLKSAAEASIRQAGRDLLLSLEKSIIKMLDAVVKRESAQTLDGKVLETSIITLLKNWKDESQTLEVLLSEEQLEKLEDSFLEQLKKELKSGVLLKPAENIDAGFRISEKDGASYYNFTAAGIAEMLSQYVNPRLSSLLRESVSDGQA